MTMFYLNRTHKKSSVKHKVKSCLTPEGRFYYSPTVFKKSHFKSGLLAIVLACSLGVLFLPNVRQNVHGFTWHDDTAIAAEMIVKNTHPVKNYQKFSLAQDPTDAQINSYLEKVLAKKR